MSGEGLSFTEVRYNGYVKILYLTDVTILLNVYRAAS
jgi:hypothetical protein